jgi:hypothetical protein
MYLPFRDLLTRDEHEAHKIKISKITIGFIFGCSFHDLGLPNAFLLFIPEPAKAKCLKPNSASQLVQKVLLKIRSSFGACCIIKISSKPLKE